MAASISIPLLVLFARGAAAGVLSQPQPAAGRRPHIFHILVDDWGWASTGWHRAEGVTDVRTPHLDALLGEGVELDRHYTHHQCGPTRSAIQSGRSPIHVNSENINNDRWNAGDSEAGYAGIPRSMTGIAEHMRATGYSTHMFGKWDAGMATPQHLPKGRGYDNGIYLLHKSNDFWNQTANKCGEDYDPGFSSVGDVIDLWQHNGSYNGPAYGRNNSLDCSQSNQAPHCVYEDQLFADEVLGVVERHDPAVPLFVFWAPLSVHTCQQTHQPIPGAPGATSGLQLQVPDAYLQRFADVENEARRRYNAQVAWLDEAIGNLAQALRARGMWDDTLVLVHSDNGGATYSRGMAGANNHPLKGGKRNLWEGGIRVNSLVTGGFLPVDVRGTRQEGYVACWDWYATWAALAGADPTDHRADAAGLPPIDSLNVWPLLSGQVQESPRTEIMFSYTGLFDLGEWTEDSNQVERIMIGAVVSHQHKLVLGSYDCSAWTSPDHPSAHSAWTSAVAPFEGVEPADSVCAFVEVCGRTPQEGCLFDIRADPEERVNLAAEEPEVFRRLLARAEEEQASVFAPDRGGVDPAACWAVENLYNGFWGPFAHLGEGEDEVLVLLEGEDAAPGEDEVHALHAAHKKCSRGSWVDGICLSRTLRPKGWGVR